MINAFAFVCRKLCHFQRLYVNFFSIDYREVTIILFMQMHANIVLYFQVYVDFDTLENLFSL